MAVVRREAATEVGGHKAVCLGNVMYRQWRSGTVMLGNDPRCRRPARRTHRSELQKVVSEHLMAIGAACQSTLLQCRDKSIGDLGNCPSAHIRQ